MKVESEQFSLSFLNREISFNNPSIIFNFLQDDLETLPGGSVSQHFELGSRYFSLKANVVKDRLEFCKCILISK